MIERRFVTGKDAQELLHFYRSAVRTRSYFDEEGDIARLILEEMQRLGFDEAYIDSVGNVVGRVGSGKKVIYDYHMDTVRVNEPEDWAVPPFSADIINACNFYVNLIKTQ